MKHNVGGIDKIIRIVVGIALLSMLLWVEGNAKWFGLIGIIPLLTVAMGWCPLYTVLGINSCPAKAKPAAEE